MSCSPALHSTSVPAEEQGRDPHNVLMLPAELPNEMWFLTSQLDSLG